MSHWTGKNRKAVGPVGGQARRPLPPGGVFNPSVNPWKDGVLPEVDPITRRLKVEAQRSTVSAVTIVPGGAVNVTLLAANPARIGATFFNDSNKILSLKLGANASLVNFTIKIPAGGFYELPVQYVGIIDGIWNGTNGNCLITELA